MRNKILVVEDQFIIVLDIKNILEAENYEVKTDYESVANVIDIIDNNPPDLILIDIHLNEEQTGIDIGNYLYKKDTIPFIYITSYSDKVTLDKVKNSRPYGFIVKPYKKIDLITTVFLVINNFQYRKVDLRRNEEIEKIDIPIQLKTTLDYIEKNINQKIDITQLAALTRWNKEHYSRVFKQFLTLTPYQYILKQKIDVAKTLIETTDDQFRTIAFDLGFYSYSNFCNAFKKATNFSPESYRFTRKSIKNRG